MKRNLLLLMLCFAGFSVFAQKSTSLKLYAGSNAPWGTNQSLTIDANGNLKYELGEVNRGVKDSKTFMLSSTQLAELDEVIDQIRFFSLEPSYNSQSRDGTRLSVEITQSGKTHTVHWINIHTTETNTLLEKINKMLVNKGIIIQY